MSTSFKVGDVVQPITDKVRGHATYRRLLGRTGVVTLVKNRGQLCHVDFEGVGHTSLFSYRLQLAETTPFDKAVRAYIQREMNNG